MHLDAQRRRISPIKSLIGWTKALAKKNQTFSYANKKAKKVFLRIPPIKNNCSQDLNPKITDNLNLQG
jgi:hypothetical protein